MALPGPWHELQLLDQLLVVKHMKPDGLKAAFQVRWVQLSSI